jgi:hypothetical protein
MTEWLYRCFVVATVNDATSINSTVKAQLDTEGGDFTLTVGLKDAVTEIETHRWCCSKMKRSAVLQLASIAAMYPLASAYIWSEDATAHAELVTMFALVANIQVGEVSPAAVLVTEGLQRIVT